MHVKWICELKITIDFQVLATLSHIRRAAARNPSRRWQTYVMIKYGQTAAKNAQQLKPVSQTYIHTYIMHEFENRLLRINGQDTAWGGTRWLEGVCLCVKGLTLPNGRT